MESPHALADPPRRVLPLEDVLEWLELIMHMKMMDAMMTIFMLIFNLGDVEACPPQPQPSATRCSCCVDARHPDALVQLSELPRDRGRGVDGHGLNAFPYRHQVRVRRGLNLDERLVEDLGLLEPCRLACPEASATSVHSAELSAWKASGEDHRRGSKLPCFLPNALRERRCVLR